MLHRDKNRRGARVHGRSSQRHQSPVRSNRNLKSGYSNQTGAWTSEPQEKRLDSASDRNRGSEPQELKPLRGTERRFNLLVDSVPYMVQAVPFRFNSELRYRVSFNGSPEHVFTWDSSLGQLRAINDDSSTMPDNLELAISEKLQSKM